MKSRIANSFMRHAVFAGLILRLIPDLVGSLPGPISDRDYYDDGSPSAEKVELGRQLFFDKILSGNRNISCATCHHPELGTSDGLALPLGEGPRGRGPDRRPGENLSEAVAGRVPRNSPALFNLGAREFTSLFHDGRVEADPQKYYEGGFITPAKWKLPVGLDNPLAAQAMFPPTSDIEMAGQKGENPIANAASLNNAAGPGGVWELLARRLRAIPTYVELFRSAYPDRIRSAGDITFVDAANAIAAFQTVAFRADDSPFDRYLKGETSALEPIALRGMELFYGRARCVDCHSGKFQTDHEFHAIAMPQIGPGKNDGRGGGYWRASGHNGFLEDFGRGRVTYRTEDYYRFRTPSLRNVAETGPWGHAGAFESLESVVRHHSDPVGSLETYRPSTELLQPIIRIIENTASDSKLTLTFMDSNRVDGFLLRDTWVQNDPELRRKIARANELEGVALTDRETEEIFAFLLALTDGSEPSPSTRPPTVVPSGLPVED
jgi:cytochrome c peroxidase